MILRNYQDNTIAQVIFKTDKDTYTLSLNKEEDHFNGTINLPIQTLQSTQLISQTNGETNSASGGIMLESYNEKKNKGDVTLSFSGNKIKKDEIYLWNKEYIEFEKVYTCKNIKKEDTVMVEYTYTNEMGIKKKQEVTAQLKKNCQGYYLAWK